MARLHTPISLSAEPSLPVRIARGLGFALLTTIAFLAVFSIVVLAKS